MKLLVITYSYHPNVNPRAFRWTAICDEWAKLGHEVHVVTTYNQERARTESRYGVSVHQIGGARLNRFREWAKQSKIALKPGDASTPSQIDVGAQSARRRWSNWVRKLLKQIHDLTWRKIYWPDASCLWIWPAWKYSLNLCRQESFDALITVSHPFSGHVVGLLLRHTFTNLPWLADSGDPFYFMEESEPNNFNLYRKLNHWTEKRLLHLVNKFTVTTQGTADIYKRMFSESAKKIHVIPPLLQDTFFHSRPNHQTLFENGAIILLFVGVFYTNIRNPRPLLELIERLIDHAPQLGAKIQLHVIGSREVIADELEKFDSLKGKVFLHGNVSHHAAIDAMHQAACLVNIGNRTSFQLPSKVVEYMATGRSILNFYSNTDDSSARILSDYPLHLSVQAGQYDDIDAIVQFVEQSPNHVLDKCDVQHRMEGFLAQSISDTYLRLLKAAANNSAQTSMT